MPKSALTFSLPQAMLHAFDTNDRINQYMLENLPADAWRAAPPEGKGRAIPDQLERDKVTSAQASKGLEQSRAALSKVIKAALDGDGRVKGFRPDVAGFVGYLIAHDAHHRGQICMLARQMGHPLSQKAMVGMWEWGSRGAKSI